MRLAHLGQAFLLVHSLVVADLPEEVRERFLAALEKLKVTATLRREKGHDIDAACGQLRLKTERALAGG